jgi:hypothetical protein
METVNLHTVIDQDGKLRLEVPYSTAPEPAEVVVVIHPVQPATPPLRWRDFYGLGKEIWGDVDAQHFVNRLRNE